MKKGAKMLYNESRMKCFYEDGTCSDEIICMVSFEGDTLIVNAEIEEGDEKLFQGKEKGDGHYLLRLFGTEKTSTFHRFKNSKIMEGQFEGEIKKGMWKVILERS